MITERLRKIRLYLAAALVVSLWICSNGHAAMARADLAADYAPKF